MSATFWNWFAKNEFGAKYFLKRVQIWDGIGTASPSLFYSCLSLLLGLFQLGDSFHLIANLNHCWKLILEQWGWVDGSRLFSFTMCKCFSACRWWWGKHSYFGRFLTPPPYPQLLWRIGGTLRSNLDCHGTPLLIIQNNFPLLIVFEKHRLSASVHGMDLQKKGPERVTDTPETWNSQSLCLVRGPVVFLRLSCVRACSLFWPASCIPLSPTPAFIW